MANDGDGASGAGNGGEPERSDSLKTFGAVVQAFREHAGLTQEEFAPLVQYSRETVGSIEQGRRFPPRDFVERAEEVLDAFGALRKAAQHLSRQPGLAAWFRQWARLEADAVSLNTYECRVVPGLLQTEAYARAVLMSVPPPRSAKEVEESIAARLARQQVLYRERPVAFSFILEQALIERHTGGVQITRELIDHLMLCAELTNVELQLVPLCQPDHPGTDGPIVLLETSDNRWLGYSEAQRTGQFIADAKEVSVLQQRYARMRSQALSTADSVSLLTRLRGAT